jgi:hypothetical protein
MLEGTSGRIGEEGNEHTEEEGNDSPCDVGEDLHATSFVKLCQENLPYSLTTLSNASMSLDVGVDQNTTIMTKLCQAQQQFPHQIDNSGHGNRSVDQKVTILPTCVKCTNRCSRTLTMQAPREYSIHKIAIGSSRSTSTENAT